MSFPTYPEYKDSGIDWLGPAPSHWTVKRLRHVARLNSGKGALRRLPPETEVTFLPMEAVGNDGSLDRHQTRPLGEVIEGYTYISERDVAFAKITPCFENGKAALVTGLKNKLAFATTELTVLRPDTRAVSARYLYRLVTSRPFRELGEASMYGAGGQKRVPDNFARDFAIPLPPPDEQGQIADFLDHETARIDSLIEEQQWLIKLLQEKREGAISHAVEDHGIGPETKLGHYAEVLQGYAFPSNGFQAEPGVGLLRGINVGVNEIRWNDTVYWLDESANNFRRFALDQDDIVFGMDRPWIGEGTRVAWVTRQDLPALLLQRVARIRPRRGLVRRFLFLILASREFREGIEADLTGVSVPHISPEQIAKFRLKLPPESGQVKICDTVDDELRRLEATRDEASSLIDRLNERRSALISAAVTGKIDVREWDQTMPSEEQALPQVAEKEGRYG